MSDSPNRIRLDPAAVARHLRRQARATEAPWLHGEVARRMGDKLDAIRARPQQVLDWWAGAGASAEVLAQHHPQAARLLLEPDASWAARSVQALKRPWWQRGRRGAAQAAMAVQDTAAWVGQADLVWANMVLHWIDDVPALMAQWHRALRPDGFLMCSAFGPDTAVELTRLYAALGWGPATVAYTDMHDLGDMLVHAGFAEPVMDMEHLTLTWADVPSMLKELQGLGLNAHPGRHPGLRTPRWRERLHAVLAERCTGADGRLRLSFEVVYGHAFRGAPRAQDGQTRIELGDLKAQLPSRKRGA
jgi:malonyl-CoA O-methyltransferase